MYPLETPEMEKSQDELNQKPIRVGSKMSDEIEQTLRSILSTMAPAQVEELSDILDCVPVQILRGPETGVIMATASDCFNVQFYLGEVLVTTAEVDCDGNRGHATILGDEPVKSVVAATVSAVLRTDRWDCISDIRNFVEKHKMKIMETGQKEGMLTAATRVRFESMAEET